MVDRLVIFSPSLKYSTWYSLVVQYRPTYQGQYQCSTLTVQCRVWTLYNTVWYRHPQAQLSIKCALLLLFMDVLIPSLPPLATKTNTP